jgi:anaerobic selenocysteine-containing dehydrogenase
VAFPYRPAGVFCGRGAISHRGGNNVMDATNLINGLLGVTDVPGGITGESFYPMLAPGADGTVEPDPRYTVNVEEWVRDEFKFPPDHLDLSEFYPHRHSTVYVAWRSIINPEAYHINYQPRAMLVFGGNPITNNCNAEEIASALKKIPFIVSIAYHFDEPTQFADIILPEPSSLERLNLFEYQAFGPVAGRRGLQGLNFKFPVVKPLYNTRDASSILLELANRLNINPKANAMLNEIFHLKGTPYELVPSDRYTWEEVVDRALKARFGEDKDIKYFMKRGAAWTARWLPEEKTYNYYYHPDGRTRHAIYNEYLLETGKMMQEQCAKNGVTVPGWEMDRYLAFFQALPRWIPHPEHQAAGEYDLYAVNWKIGTRVFGMGGLEEIPAVREMQLKQSPAVNSIMINVATARVKGLKDGDRVLCESQYGGKLRGIIKTTSLLHPKAVGFSGNFGRRAMFLGPKSREGMNYNRLLSSADGLFDPVTGAIDNTAAVKLTRV